MHIWSVQEKDPLYDICQLMFCITDEYVFLYN
jgi:hypothetical protein